MRATIDQLNRSLAHIVDVADDMDNRVTAPPDVRLRDETLRCACTVILSGFFESFLKECTQKYVALVCARRIPFSTLPRQTQRKHFVQGSELLGLKARGRAAWITADHFDLARRLSSPGNPGAYSLLWEAFAVTQGNPGPDVLEGILEALGVDNRQPRLDSAIPGGYAVQRLKLKSFVDVRNECAHTGTASNVPTTSDLRDYCSLIELLAKAIVEILEFRLGEAPFGINLRTASESEISRIPGMGIKRARAIIARRTTIGITAVSDVSTLPGFGPKLVNTLKIHAHVL